VEPPKSRSNDPKAMKGRMAAMSGGRGSSSSSAGDGRLDECVLRVLRKRGGAWRTSAASPATTDCCACCHHHFHHHHRRHHCHTQG
jgi:hypothetical protein